MRFAKVPVVVARGLLCGCYGTRGGLLRCCYAVARYSGWLVGYPGWLLRCCYGVAKVLGGGC